ncbi:MAG: hypothetical protein ACXW0J_01740 [Nitrososphaeraceae archaeon]|nr:hypothetical protein [Nitrososphaeraceae archaeon]
MLEKSNEYIKIRNLQKMMGGKLNSTQINTIFKYLERSKLIETDLDGNIIWIKKKKIDDHQTLGDIINMNEQVKNLLKDETDISKK